MKVSTNSEVYDWLVLLASRLEALGLRALSKDVAMAVRTVNNVPITEFPANPESHSDAFLGKKMDYWATPDRTEVQNVLRQLDEAFDER
jgi:hypothetical protein